MHRLSSNNFLLGADGSGRSRTNSMLTSGTSKVIETLNLDPREIDKDYFDEVNNIPFP
jgi:hypothetical protein